MNDLFRDKNITLRYFIMNDLLRAKDISLRYSIMNNLFRDEEIYVTVEGVSTFAQTLKLVPKQQYNNKTLM